MFTSPSSVQLLLTFVSIASGGANATLAPPAIPSTTCSPPSLPPPCAGGTPCARRPCAHAVRTANNGRVPPPAARLAGWHPTCDAQPQAHEDLDRSDAALFCARVRPRLRSALGRAPAVPLSAVRRGAARGAHLLQRALRHVGRHPLRRRLRRAARSGDVLLAPVDLRTPRVFAARAGGLARRLPAGGDAGQQRSARA